MNFHLRSIAAARSISCCSAKKDMPEKIGRFIGKRALQILYRLPLQTATAGQPVPDLGEFTKLLMHFEDEPVPVPLDLVHVGVGCRCKGKCRAELFQHERESPFRSLNVQVANAACQDARAFGSDIRELLRAGTGAGSFSEGALFHPAMGCANSQTPKDQTQAETRS